MEYLKSPELVADIQQYFGVERKGKDKFEITNRFWYYLFTIGTALGDEVFYISFIPFWFWNVDGAVGRRFVVVWAVIMCIGQNIKDFLRWPRPGYPVVKLHDKWSMEYGMPSTHAMVGVSIPFSVLFFTMKRYQYDFPLGLAFGLIWCGLICVSRVYLGMHTVLDVIAGLGLSILLMFPLVPIVDSLDNYFLTSPTAPILLLVLSILIIVYYPNSGKWTPTRGDTTMIVSVCVGILIGSWLNYQTGKLTQPELSPPYVIMWPSYTMLGCTVMRTVIGFAGVLSTRVLAKKWSYSLLCAILKEDVDNLKKSENTLQNKNKTIVELGCKYITCALIGFNILYTLPQLFRFLRIERPTFFTEI